MRRHAQSIRRGFTIVEVMIVLAIILVLATLVAVNVRGSRKDAQLQAAKVSMRALEKAIERFHDKFDRYPSEDEGLAVLWDKTKLVSEDETTSAKWERLVDRAEDSEKDPWGTPWGYKLSEEGADEPFDLFSYGPDKQEGTDDDIHNRKQAGESETSPSSK